MPLHGLSIATGQNEAGADTSRGADGAEYIGRLCALILRRPGPGCRPNRQRVLLQNILRQCRETVEPFAHVSDAGGQPHLRRCREGIAERLYYSWSEEFLEAGKQRLSRDTIRDATRQEINALKRESADLKHLVADLSLDLHRLKKRRYRH